MKALKQAVNDPKGRLYLILTFVFAIGIWPATYLMQSMSENTQMLVTILLSFASLGTCQQFSQILMYYQHAGSDEE